MIQKFSLVILTSILVFSCNEKACLDTPDVSDIMIEVPVQRLEEKFKHTSTPEDLEILLRDHPVFSEYYLRRSQYPNSKILANTFFDRIKNPGFDTLLMDTERVFGDFTDVKESFKNAFKIIKYYYPEFSPPRMETTVTGFVQDNYISDSLFILGLDYYLGPKAKYRPVELPSYLLKRYQKPYLAPQVMLVFSRFFNKMSPKDQTTLGDMIYYGKAYYFARHIMPCTPDSLLTGYTAFETTDIEEHEQVIWAAFLENEALYETNHFIKDKFFMERPKTLEIGEKCPDRIGRWIGWRIINAYMETHPEVTLPQLMAMSDAQEIFRNSKYKPIPY